MLDRVHKQIQSLPLGERSAKFEQEYRVLLISPRMARFRIRGMHSLLTRHRRGRLCSYVWVCNPTPISKRDVAFKATLNKKQGYSVKNTVPLYHKTSFRGKLRSKTCGFPRFFYFLSIPSIRAFAIVLTTFFFSSGVETVGL